MHGVRVWLLTWLHSNMASLAPKSHVFGMAFLALLQRQLTFSIAQLISSVHTVIRDICVGLPFADPESRAFHKRSAHQKRPKNLYRIHHPTAFPPQASFLFGQKISHFLGAIKWQPIRQIPALLCSDRPCYPSHASSITPAPSQSSAILSTFSNLLGNQIPATSFLSAYFYIWFPVSPPRFLCAVCNISPFQPSRRNMWIIIVTSPSRCLKAASLFVCDRNVACVPSITSLSCKRHHLQKQESDR